MAGRHRKARMFILFGTHEVYRVLFNNSYQSLSLTLTLDIYNMGPSTLLLAHYSKERYVTKYVTGLGLRCHLYQLSLSHSRIIPTPRQLEFINRKSSKEVNSIPVTVKHFTGACKGFCTSVILNRKKTIIILQCQFSAMKWYLPCAQPVPWHWQPLFVYEIKRCKW